jgi:hypothetical protein
MVSCLLSACRFCSHGFTKANGVGLFREEYAMNQKKMWVLPVGVLLVASLAGCRQQGEEEVQPKTKPGDAVMKAIIRTDGGRVEAEFSECVLHTTGEFAGNLDFSVTLSEPLSTEKVVENLRVRLPGNPRLIDVLGCGDIVGGLAITVESSLVPPGEDIPLSKVPKSAEMFWLEESRDFPLGTVPIRAVTEPVGEAEGEADLGPSQSQGGVGCATTVVFAIAVVLLSRML